MTKTLSLFAVTLIFSASAAFSQTIRDRVENIRKQYAAVSEKVRLAETDDDAAATGEIVVNELKINARNRQWRAVGIYNSNVKFFYTGGDTAKSLDPDRLVFVKMKGNVSARTVYDELLFSDSGDLIFHVRRMDGDGAKPNETRVYFENGKAFRIIENENVRDRLTAADLKTAAESIERSRHLKAIFTSTLRL